MSDPIKTVVEFVEGRMAPSDFQQQLYTNAALEALLVAPGVHPPQCVGAGTFFLYLLELDFDNPGDALNAEGVCRALLDALKVPYVPSDAASALYDALLRAHPGWLDVDTGYLTKHVLPHAAGRTGRALVTWLREELLARFRFIAQPPDWIQSPAWPIAASGPMVFLGQLPVSHYFHDEAAAYVFHDPATGCCETVLQVM